MRRTVLAGLILLIAVPGSLPGQAEATASLDLDVDLTMLERGRDEVSQIEIILRKKHDPSQTWTVSIVAAHDGPPAVTGAEVTSPASSYSLATDHGAWLPVPGGGPTIQAVRISIDPLEGRTGRITFTEGKRLHLAGLKMDPAQYQLDAIVQGGIGPEPIPVFPTREISLYAGKVHSEKIEKPSFRDLADKYLLNATNLMLAVIGGLFSILVAVLKARIKKAFEVALDFLGKYTGGRLAERRFLKRYLDNLIFNHKYLKLIGFNVAGISRPELEQVFVSLRVSSQDTRRGDAPSFGLDESVDDKLAVPFATALRRYDKMVILGGPGAGKTTTLEWAALRAAQRRTRQDLGFEEELLPLFIPLRRVRAESGSILDDLADAGSRIISHDVLRECPQGYLERRLKAGNCLVLLDGLDEVTDEKVHREVAQKINNLVADYPDNRYVVTCRIAGWKNLLAGFKVLETQDFSRDEIQRFILGWHRAIITRLESGKLELKHPDPQVFEQKWQEHRDQVVKPAIDLQSRRLIGAIDSNNRILAIAVNPMLLSLISLVHLNRSILPKGRTILYSQCVELLIDAWDRTRDITSPLETTSAQKESVLRRLAFELQVSGKGEDRRENLERLIASIGPGLGVTEPADKLLRDIETRSGLLIERSIDVLGFSHLTLQEYLAAKHIQRNPEHYRLLVENFDNQEWREVILLYAGLVDDATRLIRNILDADSLDRLLLAGYAIGDATQVQGEISERIVDRLYTELQRSEERREDLVHCLAAITADYRDEPQRVEERLSGRLIELLADDGDEANVSSAVAILSNARVTRGLPALVELLRGPDGPIRRETMKALASFGNLALPELERFLMAERSVEELSRVTGILMSIGTGLSARLLLTLYDHQDQQLESAVSLALSKMLRNPFVVSDLMELEASQLPQKLHDLEVDECGWTYPKLEPNAPFLKVDQKIREDLAVALKDVQRGLLPVEIRESEPLLGTKLPDFKVLLPAVLARIRSWKELPANVHKIFEQLGFKDDEGQAPKWSYLGQEVRKLSSSSLSVTLQRVRQKGLEDGRSFEENFLEKSIRYAASGYFFAFLAWELLLIGLLSFFTIQIAVEGGSFRKDSFLLATIVLCWLSYIFLVVFLKRKFRRPWRGRGMVGLLFFPFANFLKLLPFVGRWNPWRKWFAFCLVIGVISPFVGIVLDKFLLGGRDFEWVILEYSWLLPLALFSLASAAYLKFCVLRVSVIQQLILLHPEGRRTVMEEL